MIIWKKKEDNQLDLKNDAVPSWVWRFLTQRVQSEKDLEKLLNPTLSDLVDPNKMTGMSEAVERLVQAYLSNEKICIYADFDLDGTSGLSILDVSLKKIGFKNVIYYQPKRLAEGYGFHPSAVEDLSSQGVSLIVTVDVGITSFAAFEKANQLGIDVILTDHHLPVTDENGNEKLPAAYCVVNPNQKKDQSGLGYLCGAGVAFYLIRALKRRFFEQESLPKNNWDLKEVLDYFCIGTLTDMVPLINDNRVLVKHGILALQNTNKPGLRALLKELQLDNRDLTSQDVAIKFAPKLNALSRMESDILPRHIYLETDENRASELVETILKNNETRQSLQMSSVESAENFLKDWPYKDFNFVVSDQFHRGVIGLVATKIANDTRKPTFVGAVNSEGVVVGSSRLPSGDEGNLVSALSAAQNVLTRFGGHAAAAGFEFHLNKKDDLIDLLSRYYEELQKSDIRFEIEYDTEIKINEITPENMKWYDFFGPFGMGFPTPVFKFSRLNFSQVKEIKGGHIKIVAHDLDTQTQIDVLYFSPAENKKKELQSGRNYDILGEVQLNYFKYKKSVQVLMKDFKINE